MKYALEIVDMNDDGIADAEHSFLDSDTPIPNVVEEIYFADGERRMGQLLWGIVKRESLIVPCMNNRNYLFGKAGINIFEGQPAWRVT